VTLGEKRTASTFQFQVLCVIAKLLHAGNTTCAFYADQAALLNATAHSSTPMVVKVHGVELANAMLRTARVPRPLLFETVRQGQQARSCCRAVHVQDYGSFRTHGWWYEASSYAALFELSPLEHARLFQYLRYFVKMRQCCGTQLSQDFRTILHARGAANRVAESRPEDLEGLAHPFESLDYNDCHTYNLGEIARLQAKTYVGSRLGMPPTACDVNSRIQSAGIGFNGGAPRPDWKRAFAQRRGVTREPPSREEQRAWQSGSEVLLYQVS
jgi:hypothetical protein